MARTWDGTCAAVLIRRYQLPANLLLVAAGIATERHAWLATGHWPYKPWLDLPTEMAVEGALAIVVERREGRAGRVFYIENELSVGRSSECDVVLRDPSISRRHALIRHVDGEYVLEDLGSRNGVAVNGERVSAARPLRSGDEITLPGCTLVFDAEGRTLTSPLSRRGHDAGVHVDLERREVRVEGRPVALTPKEFAVIAALAAKRGRVVRKDDLARDAWPEYQGAIEDSSVEQVVARLRKKIEEDPQRPRWLVTVRGAGYRLE